MTPKLLQEFLLRTTRVETYVAAQLAIDNKRWQGVPFLIKAGKRLGENLVEIKIDFKSKEQLIIRIQPEPHIAFNHEILMAIPTSDAYANLVEDAMRGDPSHFVSYEESLASWELFTPALNLSQQEPAEYPAGSEGPALERVH